MFPPVFLTLAITISILSLQLGFSYWLSGAMVGLVVLVFNILIPSIEFRFPSYRKLPALFLALTLPITFLVDANSLRDLRILFFMLAYISVFSLVDTIQTYSASLRVRSVGIASALSILFLSLGQLILSTQAALYTSLFVFLDKWLIANKSFENVDQALFASQYKYMGLYDRSSLLYGEPSYLAVALFTCTFICLNFLLYTYKLKPNAPSYYKYRLAVPLVWSALLIGLIFMIATGSIYGLISSFFIFILLVNYRRKLIKVLPLRLAAILAFLFIFALCMLLINVLPFDFSVYQMYSARALDIIDGSGGSQTSRLYPIGLFISNPLGLGVDAPAIAFKKYGTISIDNGIISSLVSHGLTFVAYILSIMVLFLKRGFSFLPYFLYLLLVWMQSGNIFSPDKFFLSLLPLHIICVISDPRPVPSYSRDVNRG